MSTTSHQRYRELQRYVIALIGVVATSAALVTVSLIVAQSAQHSVRQRLERFHLSSGALAFETWHRSEQLRRAADHLTRIRHDDPAASPTEARPVIAGLHAVTVLVDEILALHRKQPSLPPPMQGTIERLERQLEAVRNAEETAGGGPQLVRRIEAFEFSLFQLERLHRNAIAELLEKLGSDATRINRNAAIAVALVLLVSFAIVARLLLLVRRRLAEHERTERDLLARERQLQHAGKLEALGSLIGGVAHDFNNLLTATLGNADALQSSLAADDPQQSTVREIQKASERAARLTRQLLTFSRQDAVEPAVVDLNLLIRDLAPMLRRLIRRDIELQLELDGGPCRVEVDPVQFEQVLINLAVNARDAIRAAGTLRIETSAVDPAGDSFDASLHGTGPWIRLRVSDTGRGMSPETIDRIFEPFFTTKEQGKGTGLGLSTVHGIVTASGGHLDVQSELGAGTRIALYLPRSSRSVTVQTMRTAPAQPVEGSETVLLAEDESQVRRLVESGLKTAGYRVLVANDGDSALRLCEAQPAGTIDLILSDVVMPGLRGPDMVARAQQHQPAARVIYMSGYNEDTAFDPDTRPDAPLLAKPFKLSRLLETVRRELDARSLGSRP